MSIKSNNIKKISIKKICIIDYMLLSTTNKV